MRDAHTARWWLLLSTALCCAFGGWVLAQPNIRWLLEPPSRTAGFSPDGGWMLTSSFRTSTLWSVAEQKPVATFAGWRSAFSGSRLFAAHNDRQLDIYDFSSLRRVYPTPVGVRPHRLLASRDGRWLLVDYLTELQLW